MKTPQSPGRGFRRFPKAVLWTAGVLAGVLLLLFLATFFIDEPLRQFMEEGMNESLEGYSAEIGEVDFHPIGLSVTVRNLILRQRAHPDPPVAFFPRIDASVEWRQLLRGKLVADWELTGPEIYVNLQQTREEDQDETPVEERGWQDALIHIYPLKINRLEINDGSFTYVDQDPDAPLAFTEIELLAENIRNIRSPERVYPSPFSLEARVFHRGHGRVEGSANFLAEPYPGFEAQIDLNKVPLEPLQPLGSRVGFFVSGGLFSGAGEVEYAPEIRRARLREAAIEELHVDYIHADRPEGKPQARENGGGPPWDLQADDVRMTGSFGFVNKTEDPEYRLELDDIDLQIDNYSNQFRAGEAQMRLEGVFMHSGEALALGRFRPEKDGADFDLLVAIEGTQLKAMNDLLRAHANLDVVGGTFSFYSEIAVQGGRIDGYAKPFFEDVDIYDSQQEEGEGLFDKIWEGVAGALAKLMENPEEQVATQFDLSGPVEDPEASTWQIVLQLIRNAFFDAILPGFGGRSEEGGGG